MGPALIPKTSRKFRIERVANINHVQPPATTLTPVSTDQVSKTSLGIDGDVVDAFYEVVVAIRLKHHGHIRHVAQFRHVEDLHSMGSSAIGDDESMLVVKLDISPKL